MSDTERGFLDDVLANPDDDAPRLIYADWLEDHGRPERGEFIRSQIARETLPPWDARTYRLLSREQELLSRHRAEWKKGLPRLKGVTWGGFRRGFVAEATFADFPSLADRTCWAAAPVEWAAVRWPRPGEEASVGAIPGLRSLQIVGNMVALADAQRLADSPLLSTLRCLTVSEANLGTAGLRQLVVSPHLGELKALAVPFNSVGNGAAAALSASVLPSLEALDLSETGSYGRYGEDPILEAEGFEALAKWRGLARLRSLTLNGNDGRNKGLRSLMESPHVAGLKELSLRGNGLTGRATEAFGAAPPAMRLDVLDLGENLIRDAGAAGLADAACLSELKSLKVDRCEMRAGGAKKLATAPFMATLRRLDAGHDSFGSKGLAAILDASPPHLHWLSLEANDLGDVGAAVLASSPDGDGLLHLDLSGNAIGGNGTAALAAADRLKSLLVLRLKSNPIDKAAGAALIGSPLGARLQALDLPRQARAE